MTSCWTGSWPSSTSRSLPEPDAEQTRARTLREARLAAQLSGHHHVVAIHDVQELDGDVWLVLEYLPSQSLAELTEDGRTLDVAHASRIGASVADALAAAHERRITHRDVKPGNVLLGLDGQAVKLTDFGISHAEGEHQLTASNVVSGTPAYMAREVARGEEETPASDVFSLGATLYRVIEGHPPHGQGGNARGLIYRVANGAIEAPSKAGSFTPLLMQLLETDPATRPDARTAHQLLDDFARRMHTPTVPASPSPETGQQPEPPGPTAVVPRPGTEKPRGRRTRLAAAAGAVAVLAVAAALVVGLGRGGDRDPLALPDTVPYLAMTGDPRTANPCALLDPAPMSRFGATRIGPGGTVSACRLTVSPPTGGQVDTDVSYSSVQSTTIPESAAAQTVGSATIRRQGLTGSTCTTHVALPDGTLVDLVTRAVVPAPGTRLCDVNEGATAVAVNRLAASGIRYDPARTAGITFAANNACEALGDSDTAVPGISPVRVGTRDGQSCYVGRGTAGSAYLAVRFGLEPRGRMSAYGTPDTINGKNAYIDRTNGYYSPTACKVYVEHRPSPDGGASIPTEWVSASLEGPQPSEALCAAASRIAGDAERNLR